MYQFSLQWFQQLAGLAIERAPIQDSTMARMHGLTDVVMEAVYRSVCRGLFETHKLLFSFALALRVRPAHRGTLACMQWTTPPYDR